MEITFREEERKNNHEVYGHGEKGLKRIRE